MRSFTDMSNFGQRMTISWLAVVFFLTVIYFSFVPFFRPIVFITVAAVACAALLEYYSIAKALGCRPLIFGGLAITAGYFLSLYLAPIFPMLPQIAMLIALIAGFVHFFFKDKEPFINLAVTFFGLIYLVLPVSTMVMILYFFPDQKQDGRLWLLYLLFVAKLTDTGAYAVGKTYGKRKFVPYISPKKTWEGAIGGLLVGIATSAAFAFFIPGFGLGLLESVLLGGSISLLAQVGDLAESLLKRDGKIKDSSKLPGLGGVMDIVDSLIFAAPFTYIYLRML